MAFFMAAFTSKPFKKSELINFPSFASYDPSTSLRGTFDVGSTTSKIGKPKCLAKL